MSNVVIAKIEFEVPTEVRAQEIYDTIRVGNEFVFATVDPTPFDIYCDAMGKEEEEDKNLWQQKRHEWITKVWFDEYRKCEISELEWIGVNTASFKLYTFWNTPLQVLLGFGNKFKVPFVIKYVEKNGRFGGTETYELDENDRVRKTKNRNRQNWRDLYFELTGSEPHNLRSRF